MRDKKSICVRRLLNEFYGDKVHTYYLDAEEDLPDLESRSKLIDPELHKKFIELLMLIRDKYFITNIRGRIPIYTHYDFVLVDSLTQVNNLRKLHIITKHPLQLIQYNRNRQPKLLMQEAELQCLLDKYDLNYLLTETGYNLKFSGYEVLLIKSNRAWSRLKGHQIALFSIGGIYYYGISNDSTPKKLIGFNKELQQQVHLIRQQRVYTDNCRIKLDWTTDESIVKQVLTEAKNNGDLYERHSLFKILEDRQEQLYIFHKAILRKGGDALYNTDKVSLLLCQSDIEPDAWKIRKKRELFSTSTTKYKKTVLLRTNSPRLFQFNEEGTCIVNNKLAKKELSNIGLNLFRSSKENHNNLMDNLDLEALDSLNKMILKHKGVSILGPVQHPVVELILSFSTVIMTREQAHPNFLKTLVFTFPIQLCTKIIRASTLDNVDIDELNHLDNYYEGEDSSLHTVTTPYL